MTDDQREALSDWASSLPQLVSRETFFQLLWTDQDSDLRAELQLLAKVMLLNFHPNELHPFGIPELAAGTLDLIDGRIASDDATRLKGIAGAIEHAQLQARIYDVLWVFPSDTRKDHVSAGKAIDAYLNVFVQTDSVERWTQPVDALTRALRLAQSMGKGNPRIAEVLDIIERRVIEVDGSDQYLYSARLIPLLLETKRGDPRDWAALMHKVVAHSADAQEASLRLMEQWELIERCYRAARDPAAAEQAKLQRAEALVAIAERRALIPNIEKFGIARLFEQAIHIAREVPNQEERIKEWRAKHLEYQAQGARQMIPIEIPIDAEQPDFQAARSHAIAAVKGKSFLGALLTLAELARSPKVDVLYEQAKEREDTYVFAKLFPMMPVDARGRRLAQPATGTEAARWADVYQTQTLHRDLHVSLYIEPAREQLVFEHAFSLHDLEPLVRDNPLVAPGHGYAVLRGLFDGLTGDFLSASHLLVPQLEAMLRQALRLQGELTSSLPPSGVQDEMTLNRMLEEPSLTAPLEGLLGRDTVFDLRGLLIERFGANFRNNLSHGLFSDSAFNSPTAVYLWHLALNIFSRPLLERIRQRETATMSEAVPATTEEQT
jgi:hypothetical protein